MPISHGSMVPDNKLGTTFSLLGKMAGASDCCAGNPVQITDLRLLSEFQ
ncbi:MAG: hypothetical protein LAO06_02530 [Acidobacteriia bacterium]|nr:hypothetical protein [Terriglobia bacterium]